MLIILSNAIPGLSLRGLKTESLDNLLDSENLLASNVGSCEKLILLTLESESLRGENNIEEILSLLLGKLSVLSLLNIFTSALSNTSLVSSLLGSVFSLPSSSTVLSDGVDFCCVSLDSDLCLVTELDDDVGNG